ncbi:uncharacterized protein [Mobula birostris]|uniref:uncharacterized protein isoform X1 n=1 Tax=Mobula birostris TaxID=1983395 RepID=UPI003B287F87
MVCRSLNSDGLPRYHLRRIGRRPSLPDVTNYIDFDKRVTLIGRNSEVVDYVLSSTHESQKRCISRTHARVIRSPLGNQHRLVDSSFTGVYVNDRRLDGDVVLSEGDTVTFGHPQSCRVDQGERVRQPNSEFYFMFELCDCEQERGTVPSHESTPCTTPTVLEFQQHQLSLDGWEVPAAPSGQGSSAGREARTDCHSTPVALSSQERSRNGAKVSTVAAVFLPVDGVSLRGEVRTSASPSPSSVSAGSSMGGAWDEIREPALEMDWVPPADEAKDAGAERVTEATVDRIATGNFNQHQRKGVQIQFTEQDSTLRQEAPATQSAESSMPPICDACGDSALSDWQGLLHQEDCCPHPSREGDLVTGVISGAPHRDWEETAVTDSLAPTVKSEGRHNAVSNPSEGTLVEGNSAPEHSFSAQSLEVFEDPDNRLRGACQSRGVPGGNFLPEGGIAEGTARRRENERLSGYPQEALVDPAHEDDALPQPMDVRSTPLEQLTEAGTTAGVIAGGNGSACEREKQLSSDNSHQSAIVLNCPEATLGAETSDSLPGGVSSTPAERVEKDVSLINSEMLRGPGILMESQGPHKLEAVSVRQSGWVKQRREGSSFVKEMGTATDTARAKCTTLDSSVPKPSSTSFASETKLESKLPVELAENNDSVPVATLSTFGPSDPGENERPVIPSWKLHSSPVGPQGGVQDQVSTAIDPTEGEHGYRAHGEEARALGESETHRKPPRPSTDVDVEDMQAQGELNLLDQRAQEMDTEESKEMEMEADSSCGVEAGTLREAAESQELEVGASWGMETETSQEMETRVSLGIEMGASREPEIVESQEMEVEIPHQAVISAPREIDTDASRELETERSQQMETGASLEMEMGEVLKSDSNLEGTIHLNAPPELEVATHGRVEGGGSVADVDVKHCGPNGEEDDSDAKEASELIRLSLKVDAEETGETMDKSMEVDLVSECADRDVDVANVTPAAVARKVPLPRGGAVASATRLDYEVISKPISPEPSASAGELVAIQEKMFLPERVETHSKTELINPCVQPIHRAPEGEDHLQFPVKTQELGNLFCRPEALGTPSAEVGRSAETSPFSVPEAGEGVRKPNGVLAHHQTPTPPDPILSEEGSESQTLLSLIIPEKGSETPTPPDPTLSEGSETPTPLDPTLSEEGSETPTSPDPTLSEEGSETPTPPDPALSEEGSETPTPPDPTLSEEGSETPTPPDPTLSEEGFETQTLLDPTFSERGSEIPTSPDPTLSEEGFETPTSLSPTASEKESEIPTPPDPILSEEGSETPTPPDPTLSEEGFETQTLLDPTLSEEGSETPTSLSSTTSEKESETPKSLSPTVPEGEPETPMSLGSTTSEGGPEAPTSPDPTAPEKEADLPKLQDSSVSEQGSNPLIDCERGTGPFAPGRPTISSTATVQGPTVAEGGAGIPTLGEPIVPEGVNNITRSELEINSFTSQGLTITEGESDITAPQGPSVTVRESDISAPQGPSVTERESDISVPYDLSVTERELDISDPRGPSVTREPDVTASQGPSVTKVGSDITAPQGPSVTEVGSNISAPLGLSVTESDISAPQGPGVTERGSGIFSPYGPSVTRELDITAPQGPSVTERELDISAPQGPGVTEGEIRVPTSPAANMEEHFGRKAIVLSGYKGGSDPQLNQTLPGSETLPCDGFPVAEKTTVEQKVVADDPHWPSGIIPDEWLLSWDARLHLSTPPAGGLVLSEPEKHESASSKVGTSLAAGLTDQPGQCVAGAGEGKQVGTNECQGSGASPFPSGVMGVVGGSPADPGDLQRTESQEDAKEEGGRPGELEPGLSDTVIGHLECHVVDQLEAPSTTEVGGEDAFSGIEHVEDEQSGKDHVFGGSEHGSVQSSVLSSSDLAAPGCVLKTELGQVCPNDPHTREERRFQPSVTHFASAQSSVWDTKEERSTCKASTATGVKLIPGGSDNRELVDERYGEANGPRASGPSPSQVQQVWSSGRQKEPPHTPPDPDGQLQAYTEAMPASTSGKPQAEVKKGVDAAEGTLGEKGLCVLEDGIGAVKTPSRYSDLAHDTRDRTQSLQLQLTPEKPEEDTSKKCRPPVREGGRMDTCEARQAGKRTDLAGEGKESLFPEASCRAKSMAASLDGVESETINVAHQDWGKNWVEIASRIGVDLDPGDDSSHVKLNPECPNPQHSEIKLEEEDLAGNWRSNGSRHIGSVALKRPCESELADSSSSFAPSKRKCTDQQKGPGELHSERRINLSLLSFSNQLKQNRANYIGRMVRQFFAEYRPPWEHRVPKLAVVNRQGEVARIVKDFFKSLSVPCKAEVVDGPQHSMTSSGSSQRHSHSGLESGEDQMEVSENQERQLERLCEIGPPGPALMHVTNDTKATVSHHASGGISWHDRDAGDMETCLPPEDSDVTRESEAAQESSWDATPDLLNHSPHLGQNACGITQLEENSPVEDLETPFCSTQGRKVYTEAPSPPQVGPIALPWFPSITESPKVPGHSSNVSGTEEMVCDGRDSLLLKAPHTPLKPSSCNLVDNVEESWTDQSPFRPAERTADLARDDRSSSGMSACLPALGRDSCPPNLTDPGQVMERGDPFQSREGMNSLGVVQSSSPGCCRLAQCDSVDGHYAAQLGCSNNETESDSTGEPPAPDDTHLGCSDDEIESVNLAESSALGDNFHDRTNNKLECVDVVEPALHHRSLQESDSDISHSVAQPGSNALGFSDKETESVNAKGQPADSDTALGLNEDESELGNSVEPSALDSSDLGCSDSVHQPDRVTELSGLSNNVLALSNDKIVGPSAHDDSDDEVEPVNIAETPALDSNDLSCCDSVVELVGITGSPGLDNNILGGSNDETQSVITVELPALDSSNPGRNDNLVGSVDVTEPPALDNDLDHSDDETELVISDEPQALDDNDLGHSDETELVISAEPQAPDNDLDHSDDETELVISDEPQALDDNDLGHSDDETELVISAEPQALNDSDLGRSDNVIKPVNVAESSGLNDDALGLSNDEAELGNIAEPPALDDSNLGQGENEAEPVVTTKPPACDSNAPGHRDDQIEPVNVEQLFPHCNNLSYSNMKMESDDVTERSSLDVGHNACSVDVSALGQSSPGSLAGVGSAAALGRSTERQGLSDGLSDAGGCIVRGVAPGDHAVPGQSHRKGWELPDSHSPDQGGTMGCRSSREHESGVEQSPSWLTSQPAGLQLKNPLGTTAWSTIMEDPAWSETLAQLRWGGGLRVGRTSSEKAAHLETPGEPVACREPLVADVKIERDDVPAEGVDASPLDHVPPISAPVTRNYQYLSPSLTEIWAPPGTQDRDRPVHPAMDTTRHDAGGAKQVVPCGWHPPSSGPDAPVCHLALAADHSILSLTSRGAGDPGARAGIASTSPSSGIQSKMKPVKKESGSGREAGDHACGQRSVSGCFTEPPAGFASHSGTRPATDHCPTLPVPQSGLGWCPAAGHPDLWHSTSPPTKVLHPQSPPTRTRCKSEAGLLSPSQSQYPLPPTDRHEGRSPRRRLSCGFDGDKLFPLAEAVCSCDLEERQSSQRNIYNLSPGPVRSDVAGPPPSQTEFHLSQSERNPYSGRNPAGHDMAAGASCCSEGIDEGPQRSEFVAHWGRKDKEASQPSECDTGFVPPSLVHCWAKSDEDISFQLKECSLLLRDISEALEAEGVAEQHVSEWREQIKELQEQTVPPRTYVAVVGDTGSGKSSLLNALLDEEGVLPTSAMRACTAVVVEVSHNASSRCYRADIEFFSEEEWNKELLALLSDMTDKKGRLKKRRPDPGSEASVAYSRVKAVYGRVLPYTELAQIRGVTQYLGTTKTISEVQVNDFCSKVQPYIDSRNDSSNSRGGEFWPIVKRVRVQVPNSPVLQTGAVLVDLPGVRDSNAARNSVAKEYLKTCNAVWIVANVTRAVDDKTAKETLDESLRRQLLMDGQFGCIAFICTKTDSHNVTEIMRALSMTDACSSLEAEIAELRDRIDQQQANQKAWRLELECAQSSSENGKRAKQLELAIKQLEVDLTHLRHEEGVKQRELSLNAIRARNYFCKQKICLNFKRGLQDLKCQVIDEDTDSDEDQEESDETEEEEEEDVCEVYPSMADGPGPDPPMDTQLPVFTVSSTEYLKLRDKLQRDGPPRVFHNIEDTEIPAVQRFVHRITLARRALGTEVVIRKLATFVSHVVNYLTNRRAQSASLQAKVREAVRHCLFRVREIFQQAAEDCSRNIEGSFAEVKTQLCFGKKVALKTCSDTVLRWGSRPPSGLPYPTYKATCSRNGTFSSPACGAVDFNEELSRPLLTPLQMVWNEQFSIRIPQHLGRFKVDVLEKLEYFFSDLLQRVRQIEGDIRPVNHIRWQQLSAVRAKLENFAILLMNDISARQRSISRILTPSVQTGMMPAYLVCALEHGPRCFDRMKSQMEKYVHEEKDQLFSGACRKLTDQLDLLKQEIHSRLKQFLDEICNELSVQFEPVLKPLQIIDEIIPKLIGICKWMTTVCARSQVDFNLPKIEESDEEAEPTTILRKPVASETPPLRELEKFLGKVKMMKINQTDVNPTDPVEISADEVVLKYEEHSAPHEERVPFHLLSSCEFCVSMPFLILNHRWNGEGVERTDVVVLDEERRSSQFAQWMEALMVRWQWQLVFLRLELQQGIQRLQSLRVIYQGTEKVPNEEETLFNWPGSNADASTSTSSSSIYVDSFRQSRKRPWCELDRQEFPPWGQTVQLINTETQTRPPVLKKEKRDCMDSGLTLGWECRSEPPVLEKQDCRYPTKKDFDNV